MVLKTSIFSSGLIALLLTSTTATLAQDNSYNKWSIEGRFGVHRAFSPYAAGYSTRTIDLFSAGLATRYMANDKFGIMAEAGVEQFKNKPGTTEFTTHYFRGSLQGVANLGNVLEFHEWTNSIRLLIHGGFGYSIMAGEGKGKPYDEMIHATLGLTPIFRIGQRASINLDLSMTSNLLQNKTYDFTASAVQSGFEGMFVTGSVGVSVYLGKHQVHADWYRPVSPLQQQIDSLKQAVNSLNEKVNNVDGRVTQIETDLQDSDSDGVADKFDLEPNSAPGAKVDTKGRQVKEPVLGNQTLDGYHDLFFTVQLGVYSHEVPSEVMKNITPLDTKTMPDGKIRYFSGIYHSQEEAAVKLEEAKKAGISDAFITAYYKGSRITLVEARTFLQELGPGILQKR